MDSLKYFPKDFQENFDVMQEKEIRVRMLLEELDILMSGDTNDFIPLTD